MTPTPVPVPTLVADAPRPHSPEAAHPTILVCSPRHGGNSDRTAALFAEGLRAGREAAPDGEAPGPRVLFLRDYTVSPCISCGHCSRHPGAVCPLERVDKSAPLLDVLVSAPALCIIAPIYFYHLPALLKGLIDRAQPFWTARYEGGREVPPRCPTRVILLAARPRGTRLFDGSILTCRYWLGSFGLELAPALTLNGLDAPGALDRRPDVAAKVVAYGEAAAAEAAWRCV